MKIVIFATLMIAIVNFLSCSSVDSKESTSADREAFNDYWYAGKADLSRYAHGSELSRAVEDIDLIVGDRSPNRNLCSPFDHFGNVGAVPDRRLGRAIFCHKRNVGQEFPMSLKKFGWNSVSAQDGCPQRG